MTLSIASKKQLSSDPPQNKEEAVFMFEVGEECQRRALRYLVEVADMSYGDIVKLAQKCNPKSRINTDKLKYIAKKMKADGEPLKTTKQPDRLKPRNVVENSTTPVENPPPSKTDDPPEGVIDVVVSSPPAADPTPDPPIETTEKRMFEPELLTPTGESSDDVKALIKRERQSMAERVSYVRHLQDFNQAATKHWEHLQRKYKSQGRSVIAHNMKLASASLQRDKALQQWAESLGIPADSSYEDCLWATVDLARDLDKSIRLSLYLAGFIDGPGVMDRPTGT